MALNRGDVRGRERGQVFVASHHHLANHALQAHALTVFRTEDARHAIRLQFANFWWHDHAATAAKHMDVLTAPLAQ